jgi:PleD family two-component response regulator/EAL domain-containing protein (putative c-di-GMP-specific phosphodiesterase class I)
MPASRSRREATSSDALPQLRSGLEGMIAQLRHRTTRAWDAAALARLSAEASELHALADRVGRQHADASAKLRDALAALHQSRQLPDTATSSTLLAAAEQLLQSLPASGTVARAETPPPHYWRRWVADTAAADEAPAEVQATPPEQAAPAANEAPASAVTPADESEPPYRVLIVEDDRAQAVFAEGVLNGAGIETLVASEPREVLETMARVHPDLVLMDLHMPGLSGTELTAMIRRHEAFLHTPIVFLTGDPDPEKQFEVLECGADDFLQKPIRPRHLIAAVESRVKRARALGRQRIGEARRHPATGLLTRPHLLQRLGARLPSTRGGVYFIEIEGTTMLRDRYGYAALERLTTDAGKLLARLAGNNPATRLNDNAFLVYMPDLDATELDAQARTWRDGIGQHVFQLDGSDLRLRAAVGYTGLDHGFVDANAVLDAAETAARNARALPIGIAAYLPPARAEDEFAAVLRDALADARFELLYQPIVAVAGGDEAQYQTLLRMRDTEGEMHNAAEIVPAAEGSGIIHDIDRWALERALDVLQQRCALNRPIRLFVPQSPLTLARDTYAAWLAQAIAVRDLEGPSLVIDVRLADALIHAITLRHFCDQLVPVGVQFCLSQYEHSADADALVSQLPLSYLRLSARYAGTQERGVVRDEMRTAIDRAHRHGLQVIGHRIEDPQAAATLWMGGIDFIQGNLVQHAASELDFDFKNAIL